MVERLFLPVPRGCLRFVIVVFPDHTHLLFESHNEKIKRYMSCISLKLFKRNLLNSNHGQLHSSAYSKFLNMKTRIDTSFKDDTRDKYALHLTLYVQN